MSAPALHLAVDGRDAGSIAPPSSIAPRRWILGVAAVQITVEDGLVRARLRAHRTGAEAARLIPLGPRSLVQIALSFDAPPAWPAIPEASTADDELARVGLILDGELLAESVLSRAGAKLEPPPRAFGHAYCRWLRDGAIEPGVDLTDFLALPVGLKYDRIVQRPLTIGGVASFRVALARRA